MQRYDEKRVELHASEQKFIEVMTGSHIARVVSPLELWQHLETSREQWSDAKDGIYEIVLLFIEDMAQEATVLINQNIRN